MLVGHEGEAADGAAGSLLCKMESCFQLTETRGREGVIEGQMGKTGGEGGGGDKSMGVRATVSLK